MPRGTCGPAERGSRWQLQRYVNDSPGELETLILESRASLARFTEGLFRWVSPLRERDYREYSGKRFLHVLELSHLCGALAKFWPSRGPWWDALAILQGTDGRRGYLLVEAKSHLRELKGGGCRATRLGRSRIETALAKVRAALCVDQMRTWTDEYYQYANRLAHLHFLRKRGAEAWLVYLYFLRDETLEGVRVPSTREEWLLGFRPQQGILSLRQTLGISGNHWLSEYVVEVFVDAFSIGSNGWDHRGFPANPA